jgi:hypothetical protein
MITGNYGGAHPVKPQEVLVQTATWLNTEHEAGRLGCDDDQNLTLTVHTSVRGRYEATRHTRPLGRTLITAAEHTGHLTERQAP